MLDAIHVKPALMALARGDRDTITFVEFEDVDHLARLSRAVEEVADHLGLDVAMRDRIDEHGKLQLLVCLAAAPWRIWERV